MTAKKKYQLQVEGWRGISHSYALVNQFQMLHWLRSEQVLIKHIDIPFFMHHWSATTNTAGFNAKDLEEINTSNEFEAVGVYKIYAPFELKAHNRLPTLTFGVTEFGFSNNAFTKEAVISYKNANGKIHTPSQWSKQRMMANGIDESMINVVPHAADKNYFYPMPQSVIEEQRKELGYTKDDVILLNVGSHLWNKGLDILIKSFSISRKKNKNLKLLLKDQRSTYLISSDEFIKKTLAEINDLEALSDGSINVISGHLNLNQLNILYNVSDYYLTPYRAEGFNLPALEAAAAGTRVIATKGGATDDFLLDKCHIKIQGQYIENALLKQELQINAYVEPSVEHLIDELVNCSRELKPKNSLSESSWPIVSAELVRILKFNQ